MSSSLSSFIPISSKDVTRNTSSLSLLFPQKIQLFYRILFLYYYFYYVITKTTQDGGGGGYAYATASPFPTFDNDDSMSTISNPYHHTNRKSTAFERNMEMVPSYNNSKCWTAEPFVLGSTIVINFTSIIFGSGTAF
jgi:hypothetical protein